MMEQGWQKWGKSLTESVDMAGWFSFWIKRVRHCEGKRYSKNYVASESINSFYQLIFFYSGSFLEKNWTNLIKTQWWTLLLTLSKMHYNSFCCDCIRLESNYFLINK